MILGHSAPRNVCSMDRLPDISSLVLVVRKCFQVMATLISSCSSMLRRTGERGNVLVGQSNNANFRL